RVEIHQGRLREAHERARGRPEEDERGNENDKPRRGGKHEQGKREAAPSREDKRAPATGVTEDPDRGLDERRDELGNRKRQPDLPVAEPEVVADQRPGGLENAADEPVEEL